MTTLARRIRRGALWGVGCVLALGLCSCLPVPLGDPEKSMADARYLGAWAWAEGGESYVVVIRPWDAKTYLFDAMSYTGDSSAPVPRVRVTYKGWLTSVKGKTFVTLQPIVALGAPPGNDVDK